MCKGILLIFGIFISSTSFAHKIGNQKWCLMYTESHWECVYESSVACEATLKQVRAFADKNLIPNFAPGEKTGQKKIDPTCLQNPDASSQSAL